MKPNIFSMPSMFRLQSWSALFGYGVLTSVALVSANEVNIAKGKLSVAQCVNYQFPANAFDGDTTNGATGGNEKERGALTANLGNPKKLFKTVVHFPNTTYIAQWYKIQGSLDGQSWTDILRVFTPNYPADIRLLPNVTYQYVRFIFPLSEPRPHGSDPMYATANVSEIEIMERVDGDPAGEPPLEFPVPADRTGWKAIINGNTDISLAVTGTDQDWCDPHGGLGLIINGDYTYRNEFGTGNYIEVDMAKTQTFNQMWFHGSSKHPPMIAFKLFVSDDGKNWGAPIFDGKFVSAGVGHNMPVNFSLQQKRHLKILCTSLSLDPWAHFSNISVLNTTGFALRDTGDNENIAFKKSVIKSLASKPDLLVDGDSSTSSDVSTAIIDLGSEYQIARMNIKFAQYSNWECLIPISTSNDGINWTIRQYYNATTIWSGNGTIDIKGDYVIFANYSCRYIQFGFPQPYFTPRHIISEIQVFQNHSATVGINPTVKKMNYKNPERVTNPGWNMAGRWTEVKRPIHMIQKHQVK